MEIKVTKDKVLVVNTNYIINQGEFNVEECIFNFSDEYTEQLVKKAEFVSGEDSIVILIQNDECSVPYEMLNKESFELRVYAFEIQDDELVLRYSPTPTTIYLRDGSFKYASGEVITPSELEQIEAILLNKQDKLISGVNIKTINSQSLLGAGNIYIEGASDYTGLTNKPSINNIELSGNKSLEDLNIQEAGDYALRSEIPDVSGLQEKITTTNKLASDLINDSDNVNKFVTQLEKSIWNNKGDYSKPANGIPKTDLESAVQTSLGKADTALQEHQDISGKLDTSKVKTTYSTTSGDIYEVTYINSLIGDIDTALDTINGEVVS